MTAWAYERQPGEFDPRVLDELLDRVRHDLSPAEAKNAIRRQFEQLIALLTPAEGDPIEAVYQALHRWRPHRDPARCADCEGMARHLVGLLGNFPRYSEQVPL